MDSVNVGKVMRSDKGKGFLSLKAQVPFPNNDGVVLITNVNAA
jgi:hypothetical protein